MNLKMRFWDSEKKEMHYEDKYAIWDNDVIELEYEDDYEHITKDWYYRPNVIPMLALPVKDSEDNQIYDKDILTCTWSAYWDPSGNKYPSSKLVYYIADIYDGYNIPDGSKVVGNKYEDLELYRKVMYDNHVKSKLNLIDIEAKQVCSKASHLRYGQMLFNKLFEYYPEIANQIRATKYDCFYLDEKIPAFKERVIDLFIEQLDKD